MKTSYISGKNDYFASSNTGGGFLSRFAEIFKPTEYKKIYIIKGGSGTGKSRLMREVREECEKREIEVDGILCSADSSSLDGIIIKNPKIAVIDGTAPHTTEPLYPGAVDSILNLGDFWHEEKLMRARKEIVYLGEKKSECVKRAYKLLRAALELEETRLSIISNNFDKSKLKKVITRFLSEETTIILSETISNPTLRADNTAVRLISCINKDGQGRLETFEQNSDRKCIVENFDGSSQLLFSEAADFGRAAGIPSVISYDCLKPEKINALCFPSQSLSVTLCDDRDEWIKRNGTPYKIFNMERFISRETLRSNRQKLRFLRKSRDALIDASSEAFAEAALYHGRTEEIYGDAMDFGKKEEMSRRFKEKLLAEITEHNTN